MGASNEDSPDIGFEFISVVLVGCHSVGQYAIGAVVSVLDESRIAHQHVDCFLQVGSDFVDFAVRGGAHGGIVLAFLGSQDTISAAWSS